jgi:hypothetical protein
MFDPETYKNFEPSRSNTANNHQSSRSVRAVFAGELLEGSGFEGELPEDGFEWREPQ